MRFEVVFPLNGEVSDCNWNAIYAIDAEAAVEQAAERRDAEGDYTIVRDGRQRDVWVRDGASEITKWTVYGESVPTYHAHEKRT